MRLVAFLVVSALVIPVVGQDLTDWQKIPYPRGAGGVPNTDGSKKVDFVELLSDQLSAQLSGESPMFVIKLNQARIIYPALDVMYENQLQILESMKQRFQNEPDREARVAIMTEQSDLVYNHALLREQKAIELCNKHLSKTQLSDIRDVAYVRAFEIHGSLLPVLRATGLDELPPAEKQKLRKKMGEHWLEYQAKMKELQAETWRKMMAELPDDYQEKADAYIGISGLGK